MKPTDCEYYDVPYPLPLPPKISVSSKTCHPKAPPILYWRKKPKSKQGGRKFICKILRPCVNVLIDPGSKTKQSVSFYTDLRARRMRFVLTRAHWVHAPLNHSCRGCTLSGSLHDGAVRKWKWNNISLAATFVPVLFSDKSRPACNHVNVSNVSCFVWNEKRHL